MSSLRTQLQAVIRRSEDQAATTDLCILGTLAILALVAAALFETRTLGICSLALFAAMVLRLILLLDRRGRFDAAEIDHRLGTGHRVRTWSQTDGREPAFERWLAADLNDRCRAVGSASLRRTTRERLDTWVATVVLLVLLLILAFVANLFVSVDGILPFVERPASHDENADSGFGAGRSDGAGAPGSGDGRSENSSGGPVDGPAGGPANASADTESDPDDSAADAPSRTPEAGPAIPEETPEPQPEDDPSPAGAAAGSLGDPEDGAPDSGDGPFAEGPLVTEVVVPEYFGDGPSETTTAPVAGLDERVAGESTDPDTGARTDTDAAPPTDPEVDDDPTPEPLAPELDPREFSTADEWPLRARHVPEDERDLVRRWFRRLAERSR